MFLYVQILSVLVTKICIVCLVTLYIQMTLKDTLKNIYATNRQWLHHKFLSLPLKSDLTFYRSGNFEDKNGFSPRAPKGQ